MTYRPAGAFPSTRPSVVRDLGSADPQRRAAADEALAPPGSDPGPGEGAGHGGTDGYMAPEQVRGNADARSGVYALGTMVDELTADYDAQLLRPLKSVIDRARGSDPATRPRHALPGRRRP